ncbi:MAG: hypothetical protein LBJ14_00840 [Desulfarculales bacterium]|jgi:hypothetical protein|nr:hypothetical protein [Desulfarculales bacterium]
MLFAKLMLSRIENQPVRNNDEEKIILSLWHRKIARQTPYPTKGKGRKLARADINALNIAIFSTLPDKKEIYDEREKI